MNNEARKQRRVKEQIKAELTELINIVSTKFACADRRLKDMSESCKMKKSK